MEKVYSQTWLKGPSFLEISQPAKEMAMGYINMLMETCLWESGSITRCTAKESIHGQQMDEQLRESGSSERKMENICFKLLTDMKNTFGMKVAL
jgi:hypothetical protein